MSAAPRTPGTAPKAVLGAWAVSVLAGGALLVMGPSVPRPQPAGLSPATLAGYLQRAAPADAAEVRVNGVYGSGHDGAWQITAHLSWKRPDGTITGGSTLLPDLAGSPTLRTDFTPARLQAEQRIGWRLDELDTALDRIGGLDSPLAYVALDIEPDGTGTITGCHGRRDAAASCMRVDRQAAASAAGRHRLTDTPGQGPLSVTRTQRLPVSDRLGDRWAQPRALVHTDAGAVDVVAETGGRGGVGVRGAGQCDRAGQCTGQDGDGG